MAKNAVLKKWPYLFFILILMYACAAGNHFKREFVIAPVDSTQSLENLSLAVITPDSLTISYDQNNLFPIKKYQYYIKHKLPNVIKTKTHFQKSDFQYVVTNIRDIAWETTSLTENEAKINRPVDRSVLEFPNYNYDYVLIFDHIDVFSQKGRILDSITGVVKEHTTPEVLHCIRYVLWDNRNKIAMAYGMTEIPSVALEYYIGTQRWMDLMGTISEQVFENTPFLLDPK